MRVRKECDMLLAAEQANATDTTLGIGRSLIEQLANIEFTGVLLCVVMMLVAGYICLEGYGIYKMALSVIGFCVGFSRIHPYLEKMNLGSETMLMIQAIVGLICGALAVFYVQVGIFLAAYHFTQANLAAVCTAALAERLSVPQIVYPVFAAVVGVGLGVLCGFLAAKAQRPVIVILTAVIGGFATVNFFLQMLPQFPVDMHFLPDETHPLWVFAKLFLSAAGVGVQGLKEPK